jgi:Ca2+-binding RTX toxin-like protein
MFGGDGADVLSGGDGADVLSGGNGADALTGGANGDRFDFDTLGEITGDVITDFEAGAAGTDLIDLSTIDANGVGGGNGTFAAALRTTGQAFTAVGQLRVSQVGLNTLIEGNTDNIFATAEFQLLLTAVNAANVLSTDFIR